MLDTGIYLKQGVVSSGKTSGTLSQVRSFDPFKQINAFNQPTGYNQFLLRSQRDLLNFMNDVYDYCVYYNSYEETMETLVLYKQLESNYENFDFKNLFPSAPNIEKSSSRLKNFYTRIRIFLGFVKISNLNKYQLKRAISEIENDYLPKREKLVSKYGENLILNYFFFIFLDELHLFFPARETLKNFKDDFDKLLDCLSFTAKFNTRLEGISQNTRNLDIVFRRQGSLAIHHESKFFDLIQKTFVYEVNDPDNYRLDDSVLISKSFRINFYKLFGFPKLQYERAYIIKKDAKDAYVPGTLFRYIQDMTKLKYPELFFENTII